MLKKLLSASSHISTPINSFLLLFLAFSFLSIPPTYGQKFLQIEKYGSYKVKKFYPGYEITYRLKSDRKTWRKSIIRDLLPDEKIILFDVGMVKLDDIVAVRTYHNADWSRGIALKLYLFGASWTAFTLGGALAGYPITWALPIVAGTAILTGWLIRQIFKSNTYRMGKRRRLRILDLPVLPVGA